MYKYTAQNNQGTVFRISLIFIISFSCVYTFVLIITLSLSRGIFLLAKNAYISSDYDTRELKKLGLIVFFKTIT